MKNIEGVVSETGRNLFRVGTSLVEIASKEPLIVKDGDRVVVAGCIRKGIMRPYAFCSVTEQIIWHQSFLLPLVTGILVVVCGVFIVTGLSIPLIVLGVTVTFIGILMIARGIAIILAVISVSHKIERT